MKGDPSSSKAGDSEESRIARRIEAIINMSNTSILRTIYLAGYGYLQTVAIRDNDIAYDVFALLTFVTGILATYIGSLLYYYLQSKTKHKRDYLAFRTTLDSFNNIARGLFACFVLGFVLLILTLSREGFAAFPSSDDKYIPFVVLLIGLAFILYTISAIIARQLEFQDFGTKEATSLAKFRNDSDVERYIESSSSRRNTDIDLRQEEMDFVGRNKDFCDSVSVRAIFLTNISKECLKRYVPAGAGGTLFVTISSFALLAALITICVSSVLGICIQYVMKSRRKAYVLRVIGIIMRSSYSYVFCFIMLDLVLILAPYGCGFGEFAKINALFGSLALLLSLYAIFSCRLAYLEVRHLDSDVEGESDEEYVAKRRFCDNILKQSSMVGVQATISSNMVFGSMLLFSSSVYETNGRGFVSSVYLCVSLVAISFFLKAALLDTLTSLYANYLDNPNKLYHFLLRTRWVANSTTFLFFAAIVAWLMLFAMSTFENVYGDANMTDYSPYWHGSFIGIVLIVAASVYLDSKYEFSNVPDGVYKSLTSPFTINATTFFTETDEPKKRPSARVRSTNNAVSSVTVGAAITVASNGSIWDSSSSSSSSEESAFRLAKARSQCDNMSLLSQKLIFLIGSGFYLATVASSFDRRSARYFYALMCSCIFVFGTVTLAWTLMYNIKYNQLAYNHCNDKVQQFSEATKPFYKLVMLMSLALLVALVLAVSVSGSARRSINNQKSVGAIIITTAALTFALVVVPVCRLALIHGTNSRVENQVSEKMLSSRGFEVMGTEQMETFEVQINKLSDIAVFIAANTAGELVTSQALSENPYLNYYYFVITGATFAASVATLCILASVKYFLWESKTLRERLSYLALLSGVKVRVFSLYLFSLFAWTLSLLFLNQVKTGGKEFDGSQASFVCIIALTCVAMALVGWHAKSLNVKASGAAGQSSEGNEDAIRISVGSQRPTFVTENPMVLGSKSAKFRERDSNITL